jgi:type I restriction enzyme, S subunit
MRKLKNSGIDWIGEIPVDWTLQRGKTIFAQRLTKGNPSEILLAATQRYGMIPQSEVEGVVQIKEDTDIQQFRTVHKKDFVISLRSFQGGFEYSQYEGVCSPAYQVFYNTTPICHNYYRFLFKSEGFIQKMNSMTVGIREGKNIQYSDFANSLIPIPPIEQQCRIADYLDRKCSQIDSIIAKQQEVIEKLKEYKLSVITEVVTKGLNPDVPMKDSGVDWIGEIPEGWSCTRLKYVLTIKSGDPVFGEIQEEFGRFPIYGGGEKIGYCSDFNTSESSILIGRVGARCGCITMPTGLAWATDNALIIDTEIQREYIYYILVACNLNRLNSSNAQPLITATKIKETIIPLSHSIEEQYKIVGYLSKKCASIEDSIKGKQLLVDKLINYKKSLIYEIVTGKREV